VQSTTRDAAREVRFDKQAAFCRADWDSYGSLTMKEAVRRTSVLDRSPGRALAGRRRGRARGRAAAIANAFADATAGRIPTLCR